MSIYAGKPAPVSSSATAIAAPTQPGPANSPVDVALSQPIGTAELATVTGALGVSPPLTPLQDAILDEMFGTGRPEARSQHLYSIVVAGHRDGSLRTQLANPAVGRDGIDYALAALDRLPAAQRREVFGYVATAVDAIRTADSGFRLSPAAAQRLGRNPFMGQQAQLA